MVNIQGYEQCRISSFIYFKKYYEWGMIKLLLEVSYSLHDLA